MVPLLRSVYVNVRSTRSVHERPPPLAIATTRIGPEEINLFYFYSDASLKGQMMKRPTEDLRAGCLEHVMDNQNDLKLESARNKYKR